MTRTLNILGLLCLLLLGAIGGAGAQTYTSVYDSNTATDFSATRSAGAAGSTLVNGNIDVQGGVYSTGGGTLTGTPEGTVGTAYLRDFLVRPAGENAADSRVVLNLPAPGSSTGASVGAVLRYQTSTKSFYMASITYTAASSSISFFKVVSGTTTQIGGNTSITFSATHAYQLEFHLIGTNLSSTVTDITASTSWTNTVADSSIAAAGAAGCVVWSAAANISRVQTYTAVAVAAVTASGYNVAESASGGAIGTPVTLTFSTIPSGVGATAVVTPSSSGAAGSFSASTVTLSASPQTLTWTPSANGTTTFAFTNGATLIDPPALSYLSQVPLAIGFIGDSNDQYTPADGAQTAPQSIQTYLAKLYAPRPVVIVNQGSAGTSALQWAANGSLLNAAESAFAAAGVTVVCVELGTNDCNAGSGNVPAAQFKTNISSPINDLVSKNYKVILNYAPYVVPGAVPFNNASVTWATSDILLLASYQPQIDSLVNSTTILAGDKTAFVYFKSHQSEFRDGVHYNAAGVTSIGILRGKAIYSALNPSSVGTKRRIQ